MAMRSGRAANQNSQKIYCPNFRCKIKGNPFYRWGGGRRRWLVATENRERWAFRSVTFRTKSTAQRLQNNHHNSKVIQHFGFDLNVVLWKIAHDAPVSKLGKLLAHILSGSFAFECTYYCALCNLMRINSALSPCLSLRSNRLFNKYRIVGLIVSSIGQHATKWTVECVSIGWRNRKNSNLLDFRFRHLKKWKNGEPPRMHECTYIVQNVHVRGVRNRAMDMGWLHWFTCVKYCAWAHSHLTHSHVMSVRLIQFWIKFRVNVFASPSPSSSTYRKLCAQIQ